MIIGEEGKANLIEVFGTNRSVSKCYSHYLVCGSDTIETTVDKRKQMEEQLIKWIRSVSDKEAETLMNLAKVYVESLHRQRENCGAE